MSQAVVEAEFIRLGQAGVRPASSARECFPAEDCAFDPDPVAQLLIAGTVVRTRILFLSLHLSPLLL